MGIKTIGRFVYDSQTLAAVSANGNIPIPSSTVSNKCITCDGTNITINKSGVYEIVANFTFSAAAAEPIETQMYRNGNALPGAHAIDTATTINNLTSQSIAAIVTVPCAAPLTTINFKALYETNVRIANVIITKVA